MANFTPTSSSGFGTDGSIGVGMEVFFDGQGEADQTFPVPNVNAYEMYGTIAMRSEDKADVLIRIYLDDRVIFNANMKTQGKESKNLWCYVPPTGMKAPASALRVSIGAAAAGDAWPVNCEVEMSGRWS
jgi:hypothetical protein